MSNLHALKDLAAPSPDASDDYLMGLVAAGQEQAFSELLVRYQPRIRRFCSVLLGSSAAGNDAAQEVFFKLWEWRHRYRPTDKLRELLFTMARNHCRSLGRKKWLQALVSFDDSPQLLEQPGMDLESELEVNERHLLLTAALAKLPDKFRVPLALRFLDEMPYEEIARIIGRTPSAARSRIHYGLAQLAALLPDEVVCP